MHAASRHLKTAAVQLTLPSAGILKRVSGISHVAGIFAGFVPKDSQYRLLFRHTARSVVSVRSFSSQTTRALIWCTQTGISQVADISAGFVRKDSQY